MIFAKAIFKYSFFIGTLLTVNVCSLYAQIIWPKITQQQKPWTRWWWEGSAVDEKDLTWNLNQYKAAGLGGVEITPIYGVYGQEKKFVDFLSPRWMELFTYTLKESKKLDLGVDLANGTGWPFGGPWVQDVDASKSLFHKMYFLKEGEQLKERIHFVQDGFVRTANGKKLLLSEVKKPISKNENLQELALDQVQFSETLPLISLMAYSQNGKVMDITNKVNSTGLLNWTVPTGWGTCTLYALFEGLHGKMVERAAPGGEGYAIDHFSKNAAVRYFQHFDKAFKGYDISYLRSFFNDSYEVDDAKGDANWTSDFFNAFKQLKGYDLKNELPALLGKTDPDRKARVIYDYRSVIDELLLKNFTHEWKKWGDGKGKMLRNQSHGSPANTLDLYSVVDIPETEGNDVLRFKFATSAANVSGKQLVSSESATWLNEHFLSSWGDVKKSLDLFFLGGVNHIFYHGTAYSPQNAQWPGWLFYAAVHFQPTNPQWQHFHALNQYVARVQSFMQTAHADNDVLLYYPIVDCYSIPGNNLLQHFDGMEKNFTGTDFEHISQSMVEAGYSFDFFSDRQLQDFSVDENFIKTKGGNYKCILLPGNKFITNESFAKLMDLVKNGAQLLVYQNLPVDVPGWYNLTQRRNSLKNLLDKLQFKKNNNQSVAVYGKGSVCIGSNLEALLEKAKVRQEPTDKNLFTLRRKNEKGHVYFVNNRDDQYVEKWMKLSDGAASVALFDPVSENKGIAKSRQSANGGTEVFVQLEPHATIIIQSYNASQKGITFPYQYEAGKTIALTGSWKLEFLEGGPVKPAPLTLNKLQSWTNLFGDAVKNFSGLAKYSISFKKPSDKAKQYRINLGEVHETAQLWLNGKSIATLIGPSFTTVIPSSVLQKQNQLEVVVANLMANRIAYMDRNNMPWKIFYNTNMPARKPENVVNGLFNAAKWQPLQSGIIGPVTLTPLK